MEAYTSWRQLAGYFDGDGTITISDLSNQPFKLGLSLVFTDQSKEQTAMIRAFFLGKGIQTSNLLRTSSGGAWIVVNSTHESVRSTLKKMVPHLYKKANEARAAIDYYEGKITGNAFVAILQREEAGRRERHPRRVVIDVPYTLTEGDGITRSNRRVKPRDAFGKYRAKVTPEDYASIRREHFEEGKLLCDLAREYPQYCRETVRRVLGRGRGYVAVKDSGSVITAGSE